jgi:hypothetical protein
MLLPRALVGLGGLLFVGFSVSCMNLNFGGKTEVVAPSDSHSAEGLQRGKVFVPIGQEVNLYYPVPYVSPPNLEFEDADANRRLHIVDQKPDHVRVKNLSNAPVEVPWKARGITVTAAKATDTTNGAQVTLSAGQDQQKVVAQPRVP